MQQIKTTLTLAESEIANIQAEQSAIQAEQSAEQAKQSLKQARISSDQTSESIKQGKTMVVFTIVTICFVSFNLVHLHPVISFILIDTSNSYHYRFSLLSLPWMLLPSRKLQHGPS